MLLRGCRRAVYDAGVGDGSVAAAIAHAESAASLVVKGAVVVLVRSAATLHTAAHHPRDPRASAPGCSVRRRWRGRSGRSPGRRGRSTGWSRSTAGVARAICQVGRRRRAGARRAPFTLSSQVPGWDGITLSHVSQIWRTSYSEYCSWSRWS
jgi:hypothetical protein